MTLSVLRPREQPNSAAPLRLTNSSPDRADDADHVQYAKTEVADAVIHTKLLTLDAEHSTPLRAAWVLDTFFFN